jgi:hypothetical protein
MGVMDTVKEVLNTDSNSKAIEHVCYEYFMSSGDLPDLLPLEDAVAWIEKTYDVKLIVQGKE